MDNTEIRHKKGLTITRGCCGAPGHLRISKKGTQHFYHAVDTGCNYEQVSREHLEIKYQIYRTCKSEHWETYVEFPAPDRTWISDVHAIKEGMTSDNCLCISDRGDYLLTDKEYKTLMAIPELSSRLNRA